MVDTILELSPEESIHWIFDEFDELVWIGNWNLFNKWLEEAAVRAVELSYQVLVALLCLARQVEMQKVKSRNLFIIAAEKTLVDKIGPGNTVRVFAKIS